MPMLPNRAQLPNYHDAGVREHRTRLLASAGWRLGCTGASSLGGSTECNCRIPKQGTR